VVRCRWCAKRPNCRDRRSGPTVCGDFEALPGQPFEHSVEDLPPEPLDDDDDQEDILSRA